ACQHVASVPILLQKSELSGDKFSRHKTIRPTSGDLHSLSRFSEVADEFIVRGRGPPHLYTNVASIARRIFDQQCKKTFATISAKSRHMHRSSATAISDRGTARPSSWVASG